MISLRSSSGARVWSVTNLHGGKAPAHEAQEKRRRVTGEAEAGLAVVTSVYLTLVPKSVYMGRMMLQSAKQMAQNDGITRADQD